MFLFLKKKTGDTETPESGAPATVPLSEFIPYYCHWDAHTLLTKNGELMQIVRITGTAQGRDYESGDAATVRETLRAAIADTIDTDKIALWIHTVRKRRRIHDAAQFKEAFAAWAHEHWKKKNRWKYQYYNEIYISLLYEGQYTGLFDRKSLHHVFLPKHNRRYRNTYLEEAAAALERTAAALLEKLRPSYNAQLLSVAEREGILYSEPMEFLGHLINLRSESFPLLEIDTSVALASSALTFGFNALEAKTAADRRFAAVLTLKQYHEIPPETADRVLQAPMEFVISETFNFIPGVQALKPYKDQKALFEKSGDEDSITVSGIDDMMSSDKGRAVDFGEHQVSIMVLADNYKHLDEEIAKVQGGFSELGLITIREDIKFEECFWSQLPGNFEFIRRKSTLNTARIGGFCRLNRFAGGNENGNHWGQAAALVPTLVNSPYFFNFHQGDNGHTAVFDFNSFHDQTGHALLNFLLAETRKFDARLCIFDRGQSARLFFEKLGGKYHTFPALAGLPAGAFTLNPFTLEDTPRNQSFLLAWCGALVSPALAPSDQQKNALRAAIAQLYAGAPGDRHLPGLVTYLAAADPALAQALGKWCAGGIFAGLFDREDRFDPALLLHAFDMTPVVQRPDAVIPVFSYLLHRLITALDGRPTIIVLHEAWDLVENAFFAPRLESLLEMLKQHNAMVIFTTGNPLAHAEARSFNTIMQGCATHIYMPDDIGIDYAAQKPLGLNDSDARLLRRMERQKGDFLVKQNNESTALRVDLHELDELRAIFANDSKNLSAAAGTWGRQ